MRTLGDHIRRRRLDLGQGQRILAASLGVSAETIAAWELGRSRPRARHLAGLIRFLGYDPEPAGERLADRVRALRRRLGLTQRGLAARLGLDERTVRDLERGRRKASRRVQRAFARLLRGFR